MRGVSVFSLLANDSPKSLPKGTWAREGPLQMGFGPWDEGAFAMGRSFQGNRTRSRDSAGVAQDPEFGHTCLGSSDPGAPTQLWG